MSAVVELHDMTHTSSGDFSRLLEQHALTLQSATLDTLQVNLTRLCNQACKHCHVDASPARTEMLDEDNVRRLIDILAKHPQIHTLDLTGGAPELHPQFDWLVQQASALDRTVIVRHNLTVQLDGHPVTGESKNELPTFFASHGVEVVSSLPCYQQDNTDAQRGKGVYEKSIEALKRLNAVGYGQPDSDLLLNLVYNPQGASLPPPQAALEADYHQRLKQDHGIVFNHLLTITNMPIHRFAGHLRKQGQYAEYMQRLRDAFNPQAVAPLMCRTLISVDHAGRLYDCDFNQQIDLNALSHDGADMNLANFDINEIQRRKIQVDDHCLGCTAGAGSSCGGALQA